MPSPSQLSRPVRLVRPLLACLLATACIQPPATAAPSPENSRINGDVTVSPGTPLDDAHTINGNIDVQARGRLRTARTVNGDISLGPGAEANALSTVNGSIDLGAGARVGGAVETVNGDIHLGQHATTTGRLGNVNGSISLQAATVGGGIDTVNGNITVGADSVVQGDLHVEPNHTGWLKLIRDKPPRIVVGPGAVIHGGLRMERPVDLWVSRQARIGAVSVATAQYFDGDTPPR